MRAAPITAAQVSKVAKLARLALQPDEAETMAAELDQILGYVEQLGELDTAAIEPTSHVVPLACPLRTDALRPSAAADEILARAPRLSERHFVVPRVVEGTAGPGAEGAP